MMSANKVSECRWTMPGYAATVFWAVTFLGARLLLDKELNMPQGVKIAAALLPIVPTAVFLWFVVAAVRGLDEMQRRVHLEALAIAFPLAILMLMTLGLLQLAIELPAEDWSYRHIWAYLPCFYFLGLGIAWMKYR